ncbi:hypothetical protein GB937_010573 [Aspergillus fischeri]|nr:hypothetical protein GB937_010573 [Aspergillus fischeri]
MSRLHLCCLYGQPSIFPAKAREAEMLSPPSAQLAPLTDVYPRTRDFKSAIDNGYAALSDESIDNSYLSFSGVTPQLFESIESRRDDTLNSSHVFTPKIQNPSTPSPSPSSQQETIGVVIPSPSRQLKKQIEQLEWVKPPPFTPEKTALSTEYYPIDAHEKHALKGAYPSARKIKRSEMSQTRPLHARLEPQADLQHITMLGILLPHINVNAGQLKQVGTILHALVDGVVRAESELSNNMILGFSGGIQFHQRYYTRVGEKIGLMKQYGMDWTLTNAANCMAVEYAESLGLRELASYIDK